MNPKAPSSGRPPNGRPAAGRIAPVRLMQIRSLELRARAVVEGFLRGIHRSPYHGFSVEFSEYRPYISGDDSRGIDWRLYARSDRLFIKKFEEETNLRCHLLVDQSRSMAYGSGSYSKGRYAATLAAALAHLLFRQGDAVGLATFAGRIHQYLPPRNRSGYLHRLLLLLDREPQGTTTRLAEPLQRLADILNKRGLLVLISDLLAPIEPLETHLGYLRACGHDVIVFQVLDPAERRFSFAAPVRLRDLESERDVYIDPEQARREYLARLDAHQQAIQSACRRLGIDYRVLTTDEPLESALLDFLICRIRHSRQMSPSRRPNLRSTS